MPTNTFFPLIIDAHEDLAYNIQSFQRDYTLSAMQTRKNEMGTEARKLNGGSLLGYPEYRQGRIGLVFGTLFALPIRRQSGDLERSAAYRDANQAHDLYWHQIEIYQRLTDDHPDQFRLVYNQNDLRETLIPWEERWTPPAGPEPEAEPETEVSPEEKEAQKEPDYPVGLVILMEGAEGVRQPPELEEWWQGGVRIIGPAWAGTRFCGGTNEPGPLTSEGFALLETMAALGFGLDLTHMDEQAVLQALDAYPGTILASHSNALALLKGMQTNRHLSNRVIRGLLERDGVIGIVPTSPFLKAGWKVGDLRSLVGLQDVVAQIDYICQMAGDAHHVGLGTDYDGGFGVESVPAEIDTIADLQKLTPLLAEKGYGEDDIAAIMSANWLRTLNKILPEA